MSSISGDSASGKCKRPVKDKVAGSVERFFSFCKYADTDQRHATSDNARSVAFVAHYNVDVEGRLD